MDDCGWRGCGNADTQRRLIHSVRQLTSRQQLDSFLKRYDPAVAKAARKALRHLSKRVPGATQLVYDNYNALGVGFGPGLRPSELLLSIVLYPRLGNLVFSAGAGLADPHKLLKGSGTRVRHIVLTEPALIASPAVDDLIGRALSAARVPHRSDP